MLVRVQHSPLPFVGIYMVYYISLRSQDYWSIFMWTKEEVCIFLLAITIITIMVLGIYCTEKEITRCKMSGGKPVETTVITYVGNGVFVPIDVYDHCEYPK